MLNITLLGTGGVMPMPDRGLSSVVIGYNGRKILMDCGEGTQVAMKKLNIGFKAIDIICITHMHGDHIFGLPGLLSTMGNCDRTETVTIFGPKGLGEIVAGLMLTVKHLPFELKIVEMPEMPEEAGRELYMSLSSGRIAECLEGERCDLVMATIRLDHTVPCLGYNVRVTRRPRFIPDAAKRCGIPKHLWGILQNGDSIEINGKVYKPDMFLGEERSGIKVSLITDTRPTDAIADFVRGSDLLICESTYGADSDIDRAVRNKHMTFREAAVLARKGEVKSIILTHFSPSLSNTSDFISNAVEEFPSTFAGYDGMKIELDFENS